jgi:hypothetical protein
LVGGLRQRGKCQQRQASGRSQKFIHLPRLLSRFS